MKLGIPHSETTFASDARRAVPAKKMPAGFRVSKISQFSQNLCLELGTAIRAKCTGALPCFLGPPTVICNTPYQKNTTVSKDPRKINKRC